MSHLRQNQVNKSSRKNIKRDVYMYCLLLPAIICVIIFSYIPLSGLLIAFKDYNVLEGFAKSPWVGLKHFQNIIALPALSMLCITRQSKKGCVRLQRNRSLPSIKFRAYSAKRKKLLYAVFLLRRTVLRKIHWF